MPNTRGHNAHLEALCHKHALLAERIEKALQRPSTSQEELYRLKAEKLQLKDKIEQEKHHP